MHHLVTINLFLESILLLKYLDSNELEEVDILERLEKVVLQSHCSFLVLQLELLILHFSRQTNIQNVLKVSWENELANIFHCAINQGKIEHLE